MHPTQAINHQRPRVVQLARPASLAAPTGNRLAVERKFLHPVVSILANVNVSFAIERQIVGIVKLPNVAAFLPPML